MSASKSHPAAVRRTGSAIAYIALNKPPRSPRNINRQNPKQSKTPDAKSGCRSTTRCRN
jgi:hypothetical protein